MNKAILLELRFFGTSVMWGALLLVFYDVLRIIRRILAHNGFFIAFEDLLYWVISSLLIFHMMYQQNNGIIRGFSILAMLLGMLIYHSLLSELLVDLISGSINKVFALIGKLLTLIFKPVLFLFRKIKRIFVWIYNKIKKFNHFLLKSLKKILKSGKIAVTENEKSD
ncbi:spore cortex biosynthesis protein YabQ [Anaerocolumna sp. AGMB13025]|uniref:spore cortex biosynthesis protein YabQ n=1 Tax=Anaerocolumna sp. AGMB13025 TaxID=3039116 RepID=UPI00241D0ADA|nr:spore cortex biosynthesis protein YabQ [Anaerocolumna sp. AGMB13025]WFR57187.1 spore cortex biosynthesis protein YabQ [Anaerocolumna sp. AGMB13025]